MVVVVVLAVVEGGVVAVGTGLVANVVGLVVVVTDMIVVSIGAVEEDIVGAKDVVGLVVLGLKEVAVVVKRCWTLLVTGNCLVSM